MKNDRRITYPAERRYLILKGSWNAKKLLQKPIFKIIPSHYLNIKTQNLLIGNLPFGKPRQNANNPHISPTFTP